MNTSDLAELVKARPINVQFGEDIEDAEGPDSGMRGKLVSVSVNDGVDPYYTFKVDLSPFESYNNSVDKRRWYDCAGKANLTWKESGMYPEDGMYEIYINVNSDFDCTILDNQLLKLFEMYQLKGDKQSYVSWLEDRLLKMMEDNNA